jgi:hypothetical protein
MVVNGRLENTYLSERIHVMRNVTWKPLTLLLAFSISFIGCQEDKLTDDFEPVKPGAEVGEVEEHEHGPHNGHIFEIGEKEAYHGEIYFDAETRKTTIYILGDDVKTAFPIEQAELELHLEADDDEVEVILTAVPLDTDKDGTSSRFESDGAEIPASIKDIEGIHGHLHITIDGTQYSCDVGHDEDDPDHKKKHDDKKDGDDKDDD